MKVFKSILQWVRSDWRSCLAVVIAITAITMYDRYLAGPIILDEALLNDPGISAAGDNWRELMDLGFKIWSTSKDIDEENPSVLVYHGTDGDIDLDVVFIYRNEITITDSAFSTPLGYYVVQTNEDKDTNVIYAYYERAGILDALAGFYPFGQCTGDVEILTPSCWIQMQSWDSDGTAKEFEKMLRLIISANE